MTAFDCSGLAGRPRVTHRRHPQLRFPQHPLLAGPELFADAFGHAVQAAANEIPSEAMLRELLVIAAWLEDRAFWEMLSHGLPPLLRSSSAA